MTGCGVGCNTVVPDSCNDWLCRLQRRPSLNWSSWTEGSTWPHPFSMSWPTRPWSTTSWPSRVTSTREAELWTTPVVGVRCLALSLSHCCRFSTTTMAGDQRKKDSILDGWSTFSPFSPLLSLPHHLCDFNMLSLCLLQRMMVSGWGCVISTLQMCPSQLAWPPLCHLVKFHTPPSFFHPFSLYLSPSERFLGSFSSLPPRRNWSMPESLMWDTQNTHLPSLTPSFSSPLPLSYRSPSRTWHDTSSKFPSTRRNWVEWVARHSLPPTTHLPPPLPLNQSLPYYSTPSISTWLTVVSGSSAVESTNSARSVVCFASTSTHDK